MSAPVTSGTDELVFVFDMDGVLFDTEAVKIASFRDAFAPLCADDPETLARIDGYNTQNRGVPRDVKIRHVLTELLGRPGSEAPDVAGAYAGLLDERLLACEPVHGVREFMSTVPAVRYIASSAPGPEISRNLRRHSLEEFFAHVYGAPVSKEQALREVALRHPSATRAFFGDAPADLEAARSTGTTFVALNPNAGLAELVQEYFHDFGSVAEIVGRVHGR